MTRSTNMEHVEVLERLRGVLEHGKMGDKCLIAPDLVEKVIAALSAPQPPAEAQPVACDEDRFEQFLQAAIARSPEPLRELGEYLAGVLDDDQWPAADRLLLQLATAPPSAPVGVEGLVRKVCERLDKVADYAHTIDDETVVVALSNLPAVLDRALSEALSQQPAAVDGVRGLVAKWREEATAYVVRANEKDKSGGFRWARWMRDELRFKAGVCKRHADELESALAAQPGGSDNDR